MSKNRSKIKTLLMIVAGSLLLMVLLLTVFLGRQRWSASKAMASRELIETTLSAQESYTPPLGAPIAPDRLEIFLAVRADLASYCPSFTELSANFSAVDAHASAIESSEEPPSAAQMGEGVGEIRSVFSSIYRAATQLNAYGVDRNEALLRHEMGLGEFTFINLVACFSSRGMTPRGFLGPKKGSRIYTNRVAAQVREMIGRHAMLLEDELAAATPAERPLLEPRLAAWRLEYEALTEDPDRQTFADGLPLEFEQVLRPIKEQLERLCCPATSELDLARVVTSHRVWYDHR